MKKILFALMAVTAMSLSVYATSIKVRMNAGHTIEGDLKYRDDTTIVVTTSYSGHHKDLTINAEQVRDFYISNLGRFYVENGKFVPDEKARTTLEKKQSKAREHLQRNHLMAANPNEVIGRALKSTGATAIGFGIPSLLAGTALIIYGKTGVVDSPKTQADADKNETKAKCATAGCVLMPFGAALTIVGIPLYVHGKRIAELNVNYTGNGAGVAVKF